jgi:hypothetical protein
VHSKAASTEDDSSKNEAHGDRVIAIGVACLLYEPDLKSDPDTLSEDQLPKKVNTSHTMAYRLLKFDEEQQKAAFMDW